MRKGRFLEILTSQLEHILCEGTFTVRSPEYIPNRHTGDLVEVDVTLRGKIGSTDVLVALECRDRPKRQGINWIRELSTKKDDVGASAIVAVSSGGFTKDAEAEAVVRGVVLKSLAHLSEDEIAGTILGLKVDALRPRYLLKGFGGISYVPFMIYPNNPPEFDMEDLWKLVRSPSKKGLYDKKEKNWISFSGLLERAEWAAVLRSVKVNEKREFEVSIPSTFDDDGIPNVPRYHLYKEEVSDAFIGFSRLTIIADIWYELEPAELSNAFKYSDSDKCIARVAEFNLAPKGKPADVLQVFLVSKEDAP